MALLIHIKKPDPDLDRVFFILPTNLQGAYRLRTVSMSSTQQTVISILLLTLLTLLAPNASG